MQLYKNFCKETTDENGKLTSFELVFPENYNFGYDVVDKMAELVPNDTAVVWTNPEKEEKIFTYSDISRLSNKAANVFRNHGIKKGDKVLVILKRNYEYWYVAPALPQAWCGYYSRNKSSDSKRHFRIVLTRQG